jgi:hypothetical protein
LSYTRPRASQCHLGIERVNRQRLTGPKSLPYHAIRMTNLVAIAATPTARLWWWRGATLAARWRD